MPFNFMYFILGDRAGKEKFTSLGVEPNTNSTRRAGLLAATVGLPGLIIGVRDAQKDAEAAAAAAAAAASTGGGISPTSGTAAATEFVVPAVTMVPFDEAAKTLADDPGQFQAKQILVHDPKAKDAPVVVSQDPPGDGSHSLPKGGTVTLRVHVKPGSDPTLNNAAVASTLRKIADELQPAKP